jgi:hypothetical protein
MKKIVVGIIALIVIGGSIYCFLNAHSKISVPTGYLVFNEKLIPSGYKLKTATSTDNSMLFTYVGTTPAQYLNFIETTTDTYDVAIARQSNASHKSKSTHNIENFTFNGNRGSVYGSFNDNLYTGTPLLPTPEMPDNEYYLFYEHNGRLVEIHTYDVLNFTSSELIDFIKTSKLAE